MSHLESLEAAIAEAEAAGDLDTLDTHREAYLEVAPHGPKAAEMQYRLGLSRLFRGQDVEAAMALFKEAASTKAAPIASQARISYALCLLSRQKRQQAIFELRRLLPAGVRPTPDSAQALDFLAMMLRESGAVSTDVLTVDTQRIEHLQALVDAAESGAEKAHYLLRLGAAHADQGTQPALARARACFHAVVKLGSAAGEEAVGHARTQMSALAR